MNRRNPSRQRVHTFERAEYERDAHHHLRSFRSTGKGSGFDVRIMNPCLQKSHSIVYCRDLLGRFALYLVTSLVRGTKGFSLASGIFLKLCDLRSKPI